MMKTVTVVSMKGGAGKTTMMMLASAMLARGGRVHMMDVDTDKQLLKWKMASADANWEGIPAPEWPADLTMGVAPPSISDLYDELNALEESGVDLTIIDTRGGAYSDTEELALAADIVLVPAMVSHLFFSLTLETVDWLDAMTATVADGEPAPVYRTVLMNIPSEIAAVAFASSEDDRIRALSRISPTERELVKDALGCDVVRVVANWYVWRICENM